MSDKEFKQIMLFKQVIDEYFQRKNDEYKRDIVNVKNDIMLHGIESDRLTCLKVVETRLDTFKAERRRIENIIDVYLLNNQ